jgi:hypothetical protein
MGVLVVTTYAVSASAVRVVPPTPEILHALQLAGVAETGPVRSAHVLFTRTRHDSYPGLVTTGGVIGVLLNSAFASWYDILRSERPVRLRYSPDPVSSSPAPLERLELFTGLEPLGEGPEDVSL